MKDLKHFVVDVHPNFMDTRCLFVVKEDGTREDFSVVKCIENIEKKYTQWFINIHSTLSLINQTPKWETKLKNSSSETNPSLSESTLFIICSRSSSVKSRLNYLTALLKSFTPINPVFYESNKVNILSIFSFVSSFSNLGVMRWMNCSKLILPFPSLSISKITW